ncbi:sugar-phosphatase [Izhakiella australiensis]|uniref:Sugar-phosphatase n=1 Tax=Izhakiella australiensis TaxID=1926881 RepID=A0A1S8YSB4_9GAMM|nr:Cof-type HAD-IIB family hydrolase [Izhakiella australiensis]OON41712.1 sugar-phosphatase [Izhakiella australiensis]
MIKMIAVDMDGTFLDDAKQYNRERFAHQYRELKARGIYFAVASGNQYYQLLSFFPELADEISFVAENGAWVIGEGVELFCGAFSRENVTAILHELDALPAITPVICGKQSAWVNENVSSDLLKLMSRHYHRLQKISDPYAINDTLFKFSLNLPDQDIPALLEHFGHALDGIARPVSSGFGFVDLIIPGVHKAHGLSLLQQHFGIEDNQVLAIGDSGNDAEMLAQAGFSFAMENAQPQIKKIARYQAGNNNQEGVLAVIDRVLAAQYPFGHEA